MEEWRRGRGNERRESEQRDAVEDLYEERMMRRSRVEDPWTTLKVMYWDSTVCSRGLYLTIDLTMSNAIHRAQVTWGICNICQCTMAVA